MKVRRPSAEVCDCESGVWFTESLGRPELEIRSANGSELADQVDLAAVCTVDGSWQGHLQQDTRPLRFSRSDQRAREQSTAAYALGDGPDAVGVLNSLGEELDRA